MNTEKNTTTELKEEQLDKVQGGSITLLVSAILAGVVTGAATVAAAAVKAKSYQK